MTGAAAADAACCPKCWRFDTDAPNCCLRFRSGTTALKSAVSRSVRRGGGGGAGGAPVSCKRFAGRLGSFRSTRADLFTCTETTATTGVVCVPASSEAAASTGGPFWWWPSAQQCWCVRCSCRHPAHASHWCARHRWWPRSQHRRALRFTAAHIPHTGCPCSSQCDSGGRCAARGRRAG